MEKKTKKTFRLDAHGRKKYNRTIKTKKKINNKGGSAEPNPEASLENKFSRIIGSEAGDGYKWSINDIKQIKKFLPEKNFLPDEIIIGVLKNIQCNRHVPYLAFTNFGRLAKMIMNLGGNAQEVEFEGEPIRLTNEYILIVVNFVNNYIIAPCSPSTRSCSISQKNAIDFFKSLVDIYRIYHPIKEAKTIAQGMWGELWDSPTHKKNSFASSLQPVPN